MTKFVLGTLIGFTLGVSVSAYAGGCFGTGYATGWTVEKDGEEICSDPYIWDGLKQIECD